MELNILVILIMSGLARERYLQLELPQTLFAECGVILFLISDALLAWNRFRMKFKSAQFLIIGYLLCSPVGTCNVFSPTECLLFELIIYNHAKSVKKLFCSPKKFA